MQRDNTKILMRILIILLILVIVLGIGGVVLYLTTDMFKTDETLFKKYLAQNVKNVTDVIDIKEDMQNIKFIQQNDYNKTSDISLKYLEEENDQEEIYNLKEQSNISNSNQESYRNIETTYNGETILLLEFLNQNDIYGIRLSNVVQQFISVENKNIKYLMQSIGYDENDFAEKLQEVDISDLMNFSNEEIQSLTDTYVNAIFSDIDKNSYSSKRNEMRTLNNGQSVTANSYTLTITKNDLDKIYKRILNQAVKDEIILSKIRQIDEKFRRIWY